MAETAPKVPPKNVTVNKEDSDILLLCLTAFHLSTAKVTKAIKLVINNTYNITTNLIQKIMLKNILPSLSRPSKVFLNLRFTKKQYQ